MSKKVWAILLICVLIFAGLTIPNENINKYKNMVGATVLIYNDYGHGSGVFIDDNVILTATHCLIDKEFISIELNNGKIVDSNDFYIDEKEDIGFIFVDVNEPYIAKISEVVGKLGDIVYLVGTPYHEDFKFTLIKGILSHLDRDISEMNWEDLLQTDVDGGMGYSGGPLYNSNGNLIGMYVGQYYNGGRSISLCESVSSILEAYERCKDLRNAVDSQGA